LDLSKRLAIAVSVAALATGCGDLVGVDFGSAHLAASTADAGDAMAPMTDGATDAMGHDAAKNGDAAHDAHDAGAVTKDGATPAKCVPKTCAGLHATCGAEDDGCGGVLQCGSCAATSECIAGACVCQPTTCPTLGATCGVEDDGCNGALNCGTCLPSQVCTNNACACKPTTCAEAGATCGDLSDGCGNTLDCGTCTNPNPDCGGTTPNVCGPTPCTPTTCAAEGKNCGTISDNCGHQITCGTGMSSTCAAPETCGGGGVANVCGCTPTTCATLGANCGSIADGCGGTLNCGTCTAPNACDGAGKANTCGCTPTTCATLGATCGAPSNDCGGTLSCGACGAPEVCFSSKCCTPKICSIQCAGSIPNGCGGTAICPPCTCFGAGTDITMADRSHRAIESVHVGDRILSYDEAHAAWVAATVTRTMVHGPDEGTGRFVIVNGSLRLTSNHPVWSGGSAKSAERLEVGDSVVLLSTDDAPVVTTVRTLDHVASHEVTYDLDVDGAGNFVAGSLVVIHKIVQ
jgi:hypothetical protein